MNVLVTGGAGYIGSHAVKRLLAAGHRVVAMDNLFRGHRAALDRLMPTAEGRLKFVHGDVRDVGAVLDAIAALGGPCDTVMHFAALAYVGESVEQPSLYVEHNVTGLNSVLRAIRLASVPRLVFSSSCSTYGMVREDAVPVREETTGVPVSPYGWTKLYNEFMIRDFATSVRASNPAFSAVCLRYFNVCGCDPDGVLGEDHTPETHLIPVVLQAALGRRSHVGVFGTDYPTPDGTCIRDYVHVDDLAGAHVLAMDALRPGDLRHYNVGIGQGYSVKQIIDAVERVTGKRVPVKHEPRRPGDPPMVYADPAKIRRELGWSPRFAALDDIIATAARWFERHPKGYAS